jgi:hypothetical protein
MHPIERLRYVARASGVEQAQLVRETADSLTTFRRDPAGMVMACRRMLARHPTSGPLWWLASRVCTAVDPVVEAHRSADLFDADRTARELALALPEDATVCVLGWPEVAAHALPPRGDLEVLVVDIAHEASGLVRRLQRADVDAVEVPLTGLGAAAASSHVLLVEAQIMGPEALFAVAGSRAAAATTLQAGGQVWAVAGVGRVVPGPVWQVVAERFGATAEPWDLDDEIVPLDLISAVVGSRGIEDPAAAIANGDTPVAPELFKEGVL